MPKNYHNIVKKTKKRINNKKGKLFSKNKIQNEILIENIIHKRIGNKKGYTREQAWEIFEQYEKLGYNGIVKELNGKYYPYIYRTKDYW